MVAKSEVYDTQNIVYTIANRLESPDGSLQKFIGFHPALHEEPLDSPERLAVIEVIKRRLKTLDAPMEDFITSNLNLLNSTREASEQICLKAFTLALSHIALLDINQLRDNSDYRAEIMGYLAWLDPDSKYAELVFPHTPQTSSVTGKWLSKELFQPLISIPSDSTALVVADAKPRHLELTHEIFNVLSRYIEDAESSAINPKGLAEMRGNNLAKIDSEIRAAREAFATKVKNKLSAMIETVIDAESPQKTKQLINRRKLLKWGAGAVAALTATGGGIDARLEYLKKENNEPHIFNLVKEVEAGKNGGVSPTTLTPEQYKVYNQIILAWEAIVPANKGAKEAFFTLLKSLNYPGDPQKQAEVAPVLARVLYHAAHQHSRASGLIADVLGYCPDAKNIQFIIDKPFDPLSDSTKVDIMKLLESGHDFGDSYYDVSAWDGDSLITLKKQIETVKNRLSQSPAR